MKLAFDDGRFLIVDSFMLFRYCFTTNDTLIFRHATYTILPALSDIIPFIRAVQFCVVDFESCVDVEIFVSPLIARVIPRQASNIRLPMLNYTISSQVSRLCQILSQSTTSTKVARVAFVRTELKFSRKAEQVFSSFFHEQR